MTSPDLFGGDPQDVERGLDEWVAGFERNAARYRELQSRVEDVRISATSPSGVVTVTVDGNGGLVDVTFTDRIAGTAPQELSRQLMSALGRAKGQIAGRVREVAAGTLGPEGQASADRITGYYEQRFGKPEQAPPRSDRRDDDFGGESIYGRR